MKKFLIFVYLITLFLGACNNDSAQSEKYFVSILPQKFFVEKVVSDKYEVDVLVKPGESPATYEPTTKQMIALSKAKALFTIGVPFEHAIIPKLKVQYPHLEILATDKNITKIKPASFMELFHKDHDHEKHNEEHNKSHNHSEGLDPHIWLSPTLVKQQVVNIAEYFINAYPQDADFFKANRDKFIGELNQVSQEIKDIFSTAESREFLCFHPAWGYFAQDFDLKQIPIEIEGKEPTPQEQEKIIKFAKDRKIKVIFVQAQFDQNIAKAVANNIEGQVILIDPLAEDYLTNLKIIANKLAQSMVE